MKKLLILLAVLIGVCPAAFAAAEAPWEFSVQAGGLFPQKDSRINTRSYFADGRLTYDISHYAAIGAEAGWLRFKDKLGGSRTGYLYGVPLLGDLILKAPIPQTDNRLVPYAIGGAGVMISGYDETDDLEDAGVKVKYDTHFALKGGVGLEYYVTRQMGVFAEGSVLYSKFDPKVKGGSLGGKIDTKSYLLGGGITLAF